MFGREAELALLRDARRALASRHGCVVLVGGEAGLGKSRLLAEFVGGIRGGRAPYFATAECLQDAVRPFGPFRVALEALARAAVPSSAAATPLMLRTLAALVPEAVAGTAGSAAASAPMEKAELFAGVFRYLAMVAEKRAVVVALEDLHWADSASVELLGYIASRVAGLRLMLVATYRDDEVRSGHPLFVSLGRIAREPATRVIRLDPLAPPDLRALIGEALGTRYALSQQSIRGVVAGCDGNPFFAEELLKRAIECEQTGSAAPMPLSIRALTFDRLGGLAQFDRAALDYAAVLGGRFDAATLVPLVGKSDDCVLAALRRLRDRNVVRDDGVRFAFRHALTRQTIYEEIPGERVREMHADIFRLLERTTSGDADSLAYHAWRAGLSERTREYSERAGDAALALRAAEQAAEYFERALELADTEATRLRLLSKSGEAWLQCSEFTRAAAAFVAVSELQLQQGDVGGATRSLTRAAAETANAGDVRGALDMLERFEAERVAQLEPDDADHLQATVARIATAADEFGLARKALAKVRHPERLSALTHQVYWLARLFCSEHEIDARDWERSASALERGNRETYPMMRSQMLHSIAGTAITFAEHERGLRAVDAAIALDQELGFTRLLAFANAVKACLLATTGRLNEARDCMHAALAEPDLFVARLELALGATSVALALADDELARQCLSDEIGAAIHNAGMEAGATLFDGMRAAMLFATGERAQAQRLLDASIDSAQHTFAVVHFWPFAARHADDERLGRLIELCAPGGRAPGRVRAACAALLAAARACRAGQEEGPALGEAAAARYRALGWPLHEAQALELSGRADAALALFRSAGAVRGVRRLEVRASATRRSAQRLSQRERQVAELVARGLTNRGIGQELAVTEKTIEKYVTAIYAKLGFSSRAQLAAHVARSGMQAE